LKLSRPRIAPPGQTTHGGIAGSDLGRQRVVGKRLFGYDFLKTSFDFCPWLALKALDKKRSAAQKRAFVRASAQTDKPAKPLLAPPVAGWAKQMALRRMVLCVEALGAAAGAHPATQKHPKPSGQQTIVSSF
jgi:hypothetical protein